MQNLMIIEMHYRPLTPQLEANCFQRRSRVNFSYAATARNRLTCQLVVYIPKEMKKYITVKSVTALTENSILFECCFKNIQIGIAARCTKPQTPNISAGWSNAQISHSARLYTFNAQLKEKRILKHSRAIIILLKTNIISSSMLFYIVNAQSSGLSAAFVCYGFRFY